MGVWGVAGGHAPPVREPAEAPFRVVGLGVRAPLPGGKDGLEARLRPPRAEGVAVIGPVGD